MPTKKKSAEVPKSSLYICAHCRIAYGRSEVQVDHIEPIGRWVSWDLFIEKLFCEVENLQVLCKACHKLKTDSDKHLLTGADR